MVYINRIADLVGKQFKDGGRGPDSFDCWGLTLEVFKRYKIRLPDYQISCHNTAAVNGEMERQRSEWRRCTGEIPVPALVAIAFEPGIVQHSGVYIGSGQFIHAYEKTGNVVINRIHDVFWRRAIEGFYVPGWLNDSDCNS